MQRESLAIVATSADSPSSELSEQELIERVRAGQTTAFDEVVRRHHERLIQFVFRLVGDRDEAADVAQDTFIKAHERFAEFRGHSGLFTWLYRIAYNEAISLLRRRKLRSFLRFGTDGSLEDGWDRSLAIEPDAAARMEGQQLGAIIAAAVAELPPRQRAIFTMRHHEDMSHAEIARVIGRSEGAVRANYFHAIRKLRQLLGAAGLLDT